MNTLPDTVKIIYYCGLRKKYFKRTVKVDPVLDIHRKLAMAEFKTIHNKNDYPSALLVEKTCDFMGFASKGSVPAYLFGKEYFKAKRKDTSDIWDLRKEAFTAVK